MDPITAIGLGTSLFNFGKQLFGGESEEERLAKEARAEAVAQAKAEKERMLHNSAMQTIESFPTNGVAKPMFALGGEPMQGYEAEGGEVIEGNPIGNSTDLSSALVKVKGASHAQGGVDMFGGDFVYSNRIKVPKEFIERIKSL